jgi:CRISPR-associated protein Csb1
LRDETGIIDLDTRSHPLPGDWWSVFQTIFRYDPNSLVHGVLFTSLGIKLPRVLTAHHEAFGAKQERGSGVKFDKLNKTNSGQAIFPADKVTADQIRATFVIDLALIRSFGRSKMKNGDEKEVQGLSRNQKQFLLEFALWKIGRLLSGPYRFRSGCDLKCERLTRLETDGDHEIEPESLGSALKTLVACEDHDSLWRVEGEDKKLKPLPKSERVTRVYWPAEDLFKPVEDKADKDKATDPSADGEVEDEVEENE